MTSTESRIREIAESLSVAYPAADVHTLRTLHHPEAIIWHNFDRRPQTVDENLALAGAIHDRTTFRYANIRRCHFAHGWVQQHEIVGETVTGVQWSAEACIVGRVREGRIIRIDEYVDSAQIGILGL